MKSVYVKLFALLIGISGLSDAGMAEEPSPMPIQQVRSYEALSNHTPELLGNLALSTSSAHFSKLSGDMQLRYVGARKGTTANDVEHTGDVYEVVNADAFFAPNRGRNGFCTAPVRWLTIRDLGAGPGGKTTPSMARSIRVGMLTIADWKDYVPTALGACSADTFVLKP